jgi:hypothetical protein
MRTALRCLPPLMWSAQHLGDAMHRCAPINPTFGGEAKRPERSGRAAAITEYAGAGLPCVPDRLLPLHGTYVAGKHVVSFSDCCLARRDALVLNEVAGASNIVASQRKTLLREAPLTCLSHAGCACLTDGRAPQPSYFPALSTCSVPPDLGPSPFELARGASSTPVQPPRSANATSALLTRPCNSLAFTPCEDGEPPGDTHTLSRFSGPPQLVHRRGQDCSGGLTRLVLPQRTCKTRTERTQPTYATHINATQGNSLLNATHWYATSFHANHYATTTTPLRMIPSTQSCG